MTLAHGEWIVFGWVLVNQGGLPVPVVPALIVAGALAAAGQVSLAEAFALATRVGVLDAGRIAALDEPQALARSGDPRVRPLLAPLVEARALLP